MEVKTFSKDKEFVQFSVSLSDSRGLSLDAHHLLLVVEMDRDLIKKVGKGGNIYHNYPVTWELFALQTQTFGEHGLYPGQNNIIIFKVKGKKQVYNYPTYGFFIDCVSSWKKPTIKQKDILVPKGKSKSLVNKTKIKSFLNRLDKTMEAILNTYKKPDKSIEGTASVAGTKLEDIVRHGLKGKSVKALPDLQQIKFEGYIFRRKNKWGRLDPITKNEIKQAVKDVEEQKDEKK